MLFPIQIIFIENPRYNIILKNIDTETSIVDLKFLITNYLYIPVLQQKLYHNKLLLQDEKILSDYNIIDKTTFILERCLIVEELEK